MSRADRIAELRAALKEVGREVESFRAALPQTNDPAHRAFFAGVLDRVALIVENEREGATGNLVPAITKARTDLRRYRLPDQDPDLGERTAAMTILRTERGNLVEALENALDAARDLALPMASPASEALEVPRDSVAAGLVRALDDRLDALDRAVGQLEQTAARADAVLSNKGISQSGLVNLSIRELKLDIAGARFETRAGKDGSAPPTIDLGALARTAEAIRDTSRELRLAVEALRDWVAPAVTEAGRAVARGAERVLRGVRTVVRVVRRQIDGPAPQSFPPLTPLARWREPVPGLPEEAWPDMVTLPAGRFTMGRPEREEGDEDERPQREVTVERPFAIGRMAVTFAQWDAAVAAGFVAPLFRMGPRAHFLGRGGHPVVDISWEDAQAYCAWLNGRLGLRAGTYRLPSEAEWEYACRAGTTTPFSFGDTITKNQVNHFDGRGDRSNGRTVPVGSLPANGWGLHEMHGNVLEWCEDAYGPYPDHATDSRPLTSSDSSLRVLRGGSWLVNPSYCRSAYRNRFDPEKRIIDVGFRLARTLF